MHDSKKGFIPMQHGLCLSKTKSPSTKEERDRMNKIPYASAIGSIMYAMLCTRPDVSYALSATSRYQSDPGDAHWVAVKNILKYLRRTKDSSHFQHCCIEVLPWQVSIGAASRVVELKFVVHSSFGTSLCICFSSTRPENHDFTTALQISFHLLFGIFLPPFDPRLVLVVLFLMFEFAFQVPLVAISSLRTCIALLDSICIEVESLVFM
ncbi:hypothetical protein KIW84_055734 [Lathyrus oleraceus]|uniref:Uncharacterized protein n=1 Tax=Pisum sativum TaxID=3888 RepID=A0A9D5AK58_PEA|nr:hypothetical protein KIW84_055734 [Pisum sativum]